MSRAVLVACGPWAAWMAVAFLLMWVVVRISGARWNLSRLRALHACQEGGTQTVSFVLTLPVFIMVVMFIVQVSQLMIGLTVVHYAAFAAARAAIVWMPANPIGTMYDEAPNTTIRPLEWQGSTWSSNPTDHPGASKSFKHRKIWRAAAFACMPISPSRTLYRSNAYPADDPLTEEEQIFQQQYTAQVPTSSKNSRIPARVANKLRYANRHTSVYLTGLGKDALNGPTYAVRIDENSHYTINPNEIGPEDPMTVRVEYDLALLPGPGRLLIKQLANPNGQPDRVAGMIRELPTDVYPIEAVKLTASLTMTNEGLKSAMPYGEYPD